MEAELEESQSHPTSSSTTAATQQQQDPPAELRVDMESDAGIKQGLGPGVADTTRRQRRAAALAAPSVYAAAYSSPTRRSNNHGDNSRKESRDVYPFQTLVDAFEKHMATKPMPLAARTIQMYRWMVGSVLRRLAESFPTLNEDGLPTWVRENVALVLSQYVEWEGQGWRHFLDFLEVPKEMTNVGRKRKVGGGRKPASERKVKSSGATAGGGREKKAGGKHHDGCDDCGNGGDGGGSGNSNQDKNDVLFSVEASASSSSMVASSSFTSESSSAAAATCTRKKAKTTTTTPTKHTGEGGEEGPVMSSDMLVSEEEDEGGERGEGRGGVGDTALLWTVDPPAHAAAPRGSNDKATGEEAEAEAEGWQQEGGDQKATQAAATLTAPPTPSSSVSAIKVIQALRVEVVLLRREKSKLHANLQQQAEVMTKMQARLYQDVESVKEMRQHQQQLVKENERMKQELLSLQHQHEQLLRAQQGPGTGVNQVGHQLGVPQQQQQQHDHDPVAAADLGASLQEHADLGTTDMFLLLPPGCGVDGLGREEEG